MQCCDARLSCCHCCTQPELRHCSSSVRAIAIVAQYCTRSQAVAKMTDSTASQHLSGSRDVIDSIRRRPFPNGGHVQPSLYL